MDKGMEKLKAAMISANRGYHDGLQAYKMQNPIHREWPEGKHVNIDYEYGYWRGWNSDAIPYHADEFDMFNA